MNWEHCRAYFSARNNVKHTLSKDLIWYPNEFHLKVLVWVLLFSDDMLDSLTIQTLNVSQMWLRFKKLFIFLFSVSVEGRCISFTLSLRLCCNVSVTAASSSLNKPLHSSLHQGVEQSGGCIFPVGASCLRLMQNYNVWIRADFWFGFPFVVVNGIGTELFWCCGKNSRLFTRSHSYLVCCLI